VPVKSIAIISVLIAAFLLPSTFGNTVQARICMTPDSPLGNLAKNFLNIPNIKQGIQRKMAEDPGNKTFLKVIDEASKNMTSLLCKPGEEATIFNASAPPYFPASNKTVNSISQQSNSTLTNNATTATAALQPQMKNKDSISFRTTLESTSYPGSTQLNIPQKSSFTFGSKSPLCQTNDCKQELVNAFYSESPDSPGLQGTLKIENKTTSTPDIIKYSLIPFSGSFRITGIEENRKTGNTIMVFSGDFGLGGSSTISAAMSPEFKYDVKGTFDNTTRVLAFEGDRSIS
jgi:hypothetical protein